MKEVEKRLAAGGESFDSEEVILRKLSALAGFLDRYGLSTRVLTQPDCSVGREFDLRSDDLTPLGLTVVRDAYEKWQRQAKTPEDITPLVKALDRLHP